VLLGALNIIESFIIVSYNILSKVVAVCQGTPHHKEGDVLCERRLKSLRAISQFFNNAPIPGGRNDEILAMNAQLPTLLLLWCPFGPVNGDRSPRASTQAR